MEARLNPATGFDDGSPRDGIYFLRGSDGLECFGVSWRTSYVQVENILEASLE